VVVLPSALEAQLMDRFVDRFLATRPERDLDAKSVREFLSILVYPDTVEGPLICLRLGTTSELEYLWDGSEDDATAIIDAAAAVLARLA
jgi:hypothetical protein